MKFKNLLLLFSALTFFTFCSDDGEEGIKDLDPNVATEYLLIDGATKIIGAPPAPSATGPNFSLLQDDYSGLPGVGFELKFNTDDDFAGLYLQVDGASSYYDVPAASANGLRTILSNPDRAFAGQRVVENFGLPIDLVETPETGEFCIYICAYDENGNISQIEQFCVIITNWGGNNQLVGKWKYSKYEDFEDGELVDSETEEWGALDGEYYYSSEGDCNGISWDSVAITTKAYAWIELMSSGAYTDNYLDEIQSSTPDCGLEDISDIYIGNWSYNAGNNTIAIVDFESKDDVLNHPNDPEYAEVYEEGSIYIYGTVESVNSTTLVIKEQDDQNSGDYSLIYFEKFN
ncbi:MAG: hypothetical protein KDD32_05470 [Bacteroidetes bacterium]|nr:hypothetical protein [Bacteroidota bacterium]